MLGLDEVMVGFDDSLLLKLQIQDDYKKDFAINKWMPCVKEISAKYGMENSIKIRKTRKSKQLTQSGWSKWWAPRATTYTII